MRRKKGKRIAAVILMAAMLVTNLEETSLSYAGMVGEEADAESVLTEEAQEDTAANVNDGAGFDVQKEAQPEDTESEPSVGEIMSNTTTIYDGVTDVADLADNAEDEADAATTWEDVSLKQELAVKVMPYGANASGNEETGETNDGTQTQTSDTLWTFDTYYLNVAPYVDESGTYDRHAVETEDFLLKYQMEFHANTDLPANAVKIKVEAALLNYRSERNGKSAKRPDEIGVPDGEPNKYTPSKASPFNYYYETDTETGIEYLVFFNYKDIAIGTNTAWQVLYKDIAVIDVADQTSWELHPTATVTVPAEEGYDTAANDTKPTKPLTGIVDSKITLNYVTKDAPALEKNYTPNLYTEAQIRKYTPYAEVPQGEEFADYVYVLWHVNARISQTQFWELYLKDTTYYVTTAEDGTTNTVYGDVIGIASLNGGAVPSLTTNEASEYYLTSYEDLFYNPDSAKRSASSTGTHNVQYYIVTKYPKADAKEGGTIFYNEADMRLHPADADGINESDTYVVSGSEQEAYYKTKEKDQSIPASASADAGYKLYQWDYNGNMVGIKKISVSGSDDVVDLRQKMFDSSFIKNRLYKDLNYGGWMDAYPVASAELHDLGDFRFVVNGMLLGYKKTHVVKPEDARGSLGDYIPGTWARHMCVDDFMYAYTLDENGAEIIETPLSKEDYYYSAASVEVNDVGFDYFEAEETAPMTQAELDRFNQEAGKLTVNRSVEIYAMYYYAAGEDGGVLLDENGEPVKADTEEWEHVGTVDWNDSGIMTYTFTDAQLARQPYRVKTLHNMVDYQTNTYFDLTVKIRAQSPVFADFIKDGVSSVRLENLAGTNFYMNTNQSGDTLGNGLDGDQYEGLAEGVERYLDEDGKTYDPAPGIECVNGWYQVDEGDCLTTTDPDTEEVTVNYKEKGLDVSTKALYGHLLMRDSTYVTLNQVLPKASSSKTATVANDTANARYNITYTMKAAEGYHLLSPDVMTYLKAKGVNSPSDRKKVVFYDLLPHGVQFDPSVEVKAGRLTGNYVYSQIKGLDSTQVRVTVDPETDIIENYNQTGRTLVKFHLEYTGADPSVYIGGSEQYWMCGYGLTFGAYCDWSDAKQMNSEPNLVAYMPETGDTNAIIGIEGDEVWLDDGSTEIEENGVLIKYGELFGANLNGDEGNADAEGGVYNVLFAKASVLGDAAIASESTIRKSVRADADRFGTFGDFARVGLEKTYTYRVAVTNDSRQAMKDIYIFDNIELEKHDIWEGTFVGCDISALEALGIKPVVYYSESRKEEISTSAQTVNPDGTINDIATKTPSEVLFDPDNNWVEASVYEADHNGDVSNVKSIAVDVSKMTDGSDFVLHPGESITFQFQMRSPKITVEQNETEVWNRSAYYMETVDDHIQHALRSNVVIVTLATELNVEIVKQLAEDVPAEKKDEVFAFYVTSTEKYFEGDTSLADRSELEAKEKETEAAYAEKEYRLFNLTYDEEGNEVWEPVAGMFATDAFGRLYLRAGQKAVFAGITDHLKIEEEHGLYWSSTDETEKTVDQETHTFTNSYRPLLYLQKKLEGVPSDVDVSKERFAFQVMRTAKDENGNAVTDENGSPVMEPAADLPYYYVDKVVTNGGTPSAIPVETTDGEGNVTISEIAGTTDENGVLWIRAEEIIALAAGTVGEQYTVTELPDYTDESGTVVSYGDGGSWNCPDPTASGALAVNGSSVSITNYYKWKDLYLTKNVTNAAHATEEDLAQAFTFQVQKLVTATDAEGLETSEWVAVTETDGIIWRVLTQNASSSGDGVTGGEADAGEIVWNPLSENSAFEMRANQTVVLRHLEAGVRYRVVETEYGAHFEPQETDTDDDGVGDTVTFTAPVYADSVSRTFTNEYLLRDLAVSKSVAYNSSVEGMDEKVAAARFQMILEAAQTSADGETLEYTPCAGQTFTVADAAGETRKDTTGEDGSFAIGSGETAYFYALGEEGAQYRITESKENAADLTDPTDVGDGFFQLYPQNGDSSLVELKNDDNQALFVNGTEGALILSKQYFAEDDIAQQYLDLCSRQYNIGVTFFIEVAKEKDEAGNYVDYRPVKEADQVSYMVIYNDGRIETTPVTDSMIDYAWPLDSTLVINCADPDWCSWSYRLTEIAINAGDGADTEAELVWNRGAQDYLIELSAGENTAVTGAVAKDARAEFTNNISSSKLFWTAKYMSADSGMPEEDDEITWRVERYNGVSWQPAEGIPYSVDYDGTAFYTDESGGQVFTTGSDGLIRVSARGVSDLTQYLFRIAFYEDVKVNLYSGMQAGDLRVVEVSEETDASWGRLVSYANGNGNFNASYGPSQAKGFVNTTAEGYIEVEKQLSAGTEATSAYFTFTISQLLGDGGNETLITGGGLPYEIYTADALTGGPVCVGSGVTDENGQLLLQAGQYARITVPADSRWQISEEACFPYELDAKEVKNDTQHASVTDKGFEVDYRYGSVVLDTTSGAAFKASLSKINSTLSATGNTFSLMFGNYADYADAVKEAAPVSAIDTDVAGKAEYVIVDKEKEDRIRLYAIPDDGNVSVYVLLMDEKVDGTATKMRFEAGTADNTVNSLFKALTALKAADFGSVCDMSNATKAEYMFSGCTALESVKLNDCSLCNATTMQGMFSECSSLTQAELSGVDTGKVTSMLSMFSNCKNLTSLDVSGFDTGNVAQMGSVFSGCESLTSLDVSGFDTRSATNMTAMFSNCKKLRSLDVGGFDTHKVTYMSGMFQNCEALTELSLNGWNTAAVQNMGSMFSGCQALRLLDVSGVDTGSVTAMDGMFRNCKSLTKLDLSGFSVALVKDAQYFKEMFAGCEALTTVYAGNWSGDNSYLENVTDMFSGCGALTGAAAYAENDESTRAAGTWADCDGYFTADTEAYQYVLKPAKELWYIMRRETNSPETNLWNDNNSNKTLQSLVFGRYEQYEAQVEGVTPVNVDVYGTGGIKLYAVPDAETSLYTVYILSVSDHEISLPPSCYKLLYNFSKLEQVTFDNVNTDRVTSMAYMFAGYYDKNLITSLDLHCFHTENVTDMSHMFEYCANLERLDVSGFDTRNVTDMSSMFSQCNKLSAFDISSFDTSQVTNMSNMFASCYGLSELDVSGFDTSRVTDMSNMFASCYGLSELDVSSFDTSQVTSMLNMFSGCSGLSELDVSSFDTSRVTNMQCMFQNCSDLKELDISSFDTSQVTSMQYMFSFCYGLSELDISSFDTSQVTYMNSMFNGCSGLKALDVSGFHTAKVTNMGSMFSSCRGLSELDVSGFDTSQVTSMSSMFSNCSGLSELDVSGFHTAKVTNMNSMFSGCSGLSELDVSGFDTARVTGMNSMFYGCSGLSELDVSGFDTAKVTSMTSMFSYCKGLKELDVSGFDTAKVAGMSNMFSYCTGLTELKLGDIDTGKTTTMMAMFQKCSSLKELDVSGFDTAKVNNMSNMFKDCQSLEGLDVSGFDTAAVTNMSNMFSGCQAVKRLDVSGFHTAKVTSMSGMFSDCSSLEGLDVSGFNTAKVTNMSSMFKDCRALEGLDVSGFNTAAVINMSNMFSGCQALEGLDVSGFNTAKVTNMQYMFKDCRALTVLDLRNFNVAKISSALNGKEIFSGCAALLTIYATDWTAANTKLSTAADVFTGCISLPGYDSGNVTGAYAKPTESGGYFTTP